MGFRAINLNLRIRVVPENEEWVELLRENYKQELNLPHYRVSFGLG